MELKDVIKDLNAYIRPDDYQSDPRVVKLTHTGFFETHEVGYARNGMSDLLDFRSVVSEVKGLRVEQEGHGLATLYMKLSTLSRSRSILLRLRVKDKTHVFTYDKNSKDNWALSRALEKADLSFIDSDQHKDRFEDFKKDQLNIEDEVEGVVHLNKRQQVAPSEYQVKQLRAQFAKEQFELQIGYRGDGLNKLCSLMGVKVLDSFEYDRRIMIKPEFIKATKSKVVIGYIESNTYNSLPFTLTFEKVGKDIKRVKLKDLGIETRGYYSHDDRMTILPEQVKAAKAFSRQFSAKRSDGVSRALKKAKGAA